MCPRYLVILMFWLSLCLQQSLAQSPSKSEALSVAALQKRIKSVQDNSELPASSKDQILSYLQRAVERLELAQDAAEKSEKFERRLPKVDEAMKVVQKRLNSVPTAVDPSIAEVPEIDEFERIVESQEKQIDDPETGLRKQIADLDQEVELHRVRPEELTKELVEIDDRLHEIDDELENVSSSGESREVLQAHQIFLLARRQRAESERRALLAESAWYHSEAVSNLLQAQQELARKTLTLKVAELEFLQGELGKRRGNEADQRIRQAEATVAHASDDLKPIAEQNLELAKEQREIAKKLRENELRHESNSVMLVDLEREFGRTRRMVEQVGLTDSIGLLLRQQRAKLLDVRTIRSNIVHRNDTVRETRMRRFQLELDRNSLVDLDAAAAKRADELSLENGKKSVSAGLKTLLGEQRQLLKGLETDYEKYFESLIEIDNLERRLFDLTTKYSDYVDELVLWIRTGQSFGTEQIAKAAPALRWISDRKLWQSVIDAVRYDYARRPIRWLFATFGLLTWLGLRPFLKGWIIKKGTRAAEINCREMWPTLQAMAFSLIVACGLPSVIWFVGWRLDHVGVATPFARSVATGLMRAATFAIPLEILRIICLRGGLAERHFDWPPQLVTRWRRNLNWFSPVSFVLVALIGLLEGPADEHRLDAFGRMAFMAFAILSTIFCQLTIRRIPKLKALADGRSAADIDPASIRFWQIAPRVTIAVCLGLFALTWIGYFYTTLQLTWRLQRTAWLAVGLLLVRAAIRRWISLERRRMAVLQEVELQTIAEAGQEPDTGSQNPFLFPRWNWPDFRLNLTQIVTQMRSLLDTGLLTIGAIGLWFVWADVTPALNILDKVTVWHSVVEQTETTTDKDNVPISQIVKKLKPVTAANLAVGILVIAIAVIASRNIPGLVEVILLEHLSVDAGIRFATTYLVRYAIFVAGVCCAFAQIGVGWSNVQWLVAAGSVGLGFGLQEIFCNFVSGIILLFERPMRVGDVITIGDTTGTVSRIRFRATTIVDGDRKELIVPNKDFITGKLLNWTLSDRVNRVAVKVVVSGTNDANRVRSILLDIAAQHPLLLKDPAPSATLEELNGGLNFMLRGFLPSLEGRSGAINDLYAEIHDRLKAEGIEMPCPSQEVFVRMDRNTSVSSTPPAPHQIPTGMPTKPFSADLGTAFRRA